MPKVPAYRQAAGGGVLENNKEVVFYGPNENLSKWNHLFSEPGMNLTPNDYLFVFFEDNTAQPDESSRPRPITQIDNSNVFQIYPFTPTKKFNDGYKHQVLGVYWEGEGAGNFKLKHAGAFSSGNSKRPYFYIESFPVDPYTKQPTKYWGTIVRNSPTSFGKRKAKNPMSKVNADIRYLMSMR